MGSILVLNQELPLKQGLKLSRSLCNRGTSTAQLGTSIKTRIETEALKEEDEYYFDSTRNFH